MALHLILLNFLIYEENFLFFFISAAETNIDDAYPYMGMPTKVKYRGGKRILSAVHTCSIVEVLKGECHIVHFI